MKQTNTLAICLVFLMIISGIAGITLSALNSGLGLFVAYTEDSNILNLVTSIFYFFYLMKWIPQNKQNERIIKIIRYVSTSCVALTFFVVLFILAPMLGGIEGFLVMFFSGSMFFNHFLTPILAVTSFVFFERQPQLSNRTAFFALIPTIIYGTITISLNALEIMDGPYPFLRVRNQSVLMSIIWIVLVYALNYFIARLILFFNRKIAC